MNRHSWCNYKALSALLRRNIVSMKRTYIDGITNALIISTVVSFSCGFMLPLLNITTTVLTNMFIGSIFFICVQIIHTRALAFVFDIQSVRTLDFYMVAPFSTHTFIIAHTLSLMLEFVAVSLPAFLWGKILLGAALPFHHAQWHAVIPMYTAAILFMALLTLALGLCSPFSWYVTSAHARFLVPLAYLGCATIPWNGIQQFFPRLKYLFLISPVTYILEGMRSTLLEHHLSIPVWVCFFITILYSGICFMAIHYALRKRLDYV